MIRANLFRVSRAACAIVALSLLAGCGGKHSSKPSVAASTMSARLDGASWQSNAPGTPIASWTDPGPFGIASLLLVGAELQPSGPPLVVGVTAFAPIAPDTIDLGTLASGLVAEVQIVGTDTTVTVWETDSSHVGTLRLSSVNVATKRVSGSFEFDAWNADSASTRQVREGVFDVTWSEDSPVAPAWLRPVARRMQAALASRHASRRLGR